MTWAEDAARIQRSWLAGGYTLMSQSTELFAEFHAFLREEALSRAGTKLDHGLLAVGHGTVPLRAHVKLHCVPFFW